ncbi:MAG: S41 family peptidase [Bdellovibrionia bacterium]
MNWLFYQFEENYAPLNYKEERYGFKMSELKEKYMAEALRSKDNAEFYRLVHRFVAEFHDAHTSVAFTHGNLKNRAEIAYLGFSGKRKGDVFVVTELLPTFRSELSNFPIQKGDEISLLDGKSLKSLIEQDFAPYEDLGQDESNLTLHMARLFNRISTSTPMPKKKDAVVTVTARLLTLAECQELEISASDCEQGVKRKMKQDYTLPWIKKDLVSFRSDQAKAKKAELKEEGVLLDQRIHRDEPRGDLPAHFPDGFRFEDSSGPSILVGLQGFDGRIQSLKEIFSKIFPKAAGYNYLESFFLPDQVEGWVALDPQVMVEATAQEKFKALRRLPKDAHWITPPRAAFPTYLSSQPFFDARGRHQGDKLVATLYLSTFSPRVQEEEVMAEFQQTLETLAFYQVEDLVIDLLNNGGGSLSLGMRMAQALSLKKVKMPSLQFITSQSWLDDFETLSERAGSDSEREIARRVFEKLLKDRRDGKRLSAPMSAELLIPFTLYPNDRLPYRLNIALMVNEMCASMCDIFSAILSDNGLATVVGSQTMGAGGNVVAHAEAPVSHMVIRQTESLVVRTDPQKSYIENLGVTPDLSIPVSRDVESQYQGVHALAIRSLLGMPKAAKRTR